MWFLHQFDSLIHLGTCKEYPIMAKSKSPKTIASRSKKNGKTNGMPEVPAEVVPVTQAERVAAEIDPKKHEGAPLRKEETLPQTESNPEPLPSAAKDLELAIRQRAYQIFLERHGAPGNPIEDWARAEREIREAFKHQKSA
jgi:hypothetical protein